jgi:hypothetical protein
MKEQVPPQINLHYISEASDGELEIRLILYVDRRGSRGVAKVEHQVRATLLDNFKKVNFPIDGKMVYDRVTKDYDKHYHFYEGKMIADKFISVMDGFRQQGVSVFPEQNFNEVIRKTPFDKKKKWYTDISTTVESVEKFKDQFS